MTVKSALLIGFIVWAAAGAFLSIERADTPSDVHSTGSFFSYADRTPLTP